jgi:hypothetical protein
MQEKKQLELSFSTGAGFRAGVLRRRRMSRARWWFRQMHRAVSEARDWEPIEPPAASRAQVCLPLPKQASKPDISQAA